MNDDWPKPVPNWPLYVMVISGAVSMLVASFACAFKMLTS